MRNFVLLTVVLLIAGFTSFAQQVRPKKYTTPLAGKVVLSEVQDKYNAHVYSMELPDPDAEADQQRLQIIKDQIRKNYPHQNSRMAQRTTSANPPIVATSFVADSSPGIPPDNYTAVNQNNQAVSVMNEFISVHDATTGAYLTRKDIMTFSASVGLNNSLRVTYNYRYDPKIVYDPVADRFICIMLNSTDQYNWIVLGFSQTNDPDAAWAFYKFYGDYAADTTWFDYPAISITQNEVFFTGNKIKYDSSWQAGFTHSVIYQVRKQDGYSGDTALTYQIWDSVKFDDNYLRCLYPLNPGNTLLGPSQYFLSNRDFDVSNDSVFLVEIPDTIGSADSFLTVTPVVSTMSSYGVPPDARQPDTSLTLATNDGRVLGGFIQGTEIQFVSTSLNPANGASAIYFGIISNFNTSPVLTGQIYSIDSLDFGYPNISYAGSPAGSNQSIISFDYSGPNTYPGFGAIFFDGSNLSEMTTIISGDTTISQLSQKEQRWGDYSGSQPDWTSTGTVWVEGIFGKKRRQYGNYMAKLVSPYYESVPAISTPIAQTSKIYPNPGWQFVSYEFNVNTEQMFGFVIYDMQGRVVDNLLSQNCKEGKNILQFNVAPLVPGTYFLTGTGAKGETIPVHTFVRK